MKKDIRFLLMVIIMSLVTMVVFAQPSDPGGDPDVQPVLSPAIANHVRGKDTRDNRRIKKMLAINEPYRVRDHEQRKFERRQLPRPKEWKLWSVGLFVFAGIVINSKDGTNK